MKRIVFIYHELSQSGAVRYIYEICRQLDRTKYEPHVLVCPGVTADHYFYRPLRDLGVQIHTDLRRSRAVLGRRRDVGVRSLLDLYSELDAELTRRSLERFLASFDIVSVILIEVYNWLQAGLGAHDNVVVHLLSDRLQYDYNPYALARLRPRGVIFQHEQQVDEVAGSALQGVASEIVPLPLRFGPSAQKLGAFHDAGKPRIAVFIRLGPERPIEGLLFAFKEVLGEFPEASLHLHGAGDLTHANRLISILRMGDRVVFGGHVEIPRILTSGDYSLVWSTSRSDSHGYAAIEVANCGVPLMFWNVDPLTCAQPLPWWVCDTAHDLATRSCELLRSRDKLRQVADEQLGCFEHKHSAANVVPLLESFYGRLLRPSCDGVHH
jgi:glycosyltransferase involved in cell wall biosynthesis